MQKEFWEAEYTGKEFLPSSVRKEPSRVLVDFIESHKDLKGKALDMGSGKGRNSIYLANQGFEVVGTDISSKAIAFAKAATKEAGLQNKVSYIEHDVSQQLDFSDESFDLITDMMMLHLLTAEERKAYSHEVIRLLKPNGYFMFYTISVDSPSAQKLFASSPGPEPNSYVIPQSGMIEKGFTKDELIELFSPLQIENFSTMIDQTPAFGDVYDQIYWVCSMKKI